MMLGRWEVVTVRRVAAVRAKAAFDEAIGSLIAAFVAVVTAESLYETELLGN